MGISFLFILYFFLDRDLTFSLCPPHPKTPTVSSQLPSKAGVRKGTAAVQVCMQTSEGMSTHRRSRRCSTNPPGGRRSGSGPGGSWGPPLPHTGLGHTLGKRQDLSAGSRPCLVTPGPALSLPSSPARTQSPELSLLPDPRCRAPYLPHVVSVPLSLPRTSHHSCSWGSRSPPESG